VVACPPEREYELTLLLSRFKFTLEVNKVVSLKVLPYLQALSKGGLVWLEGLGQITKSLLDEPGLLDNRRVFLRLNFDDIISGLITSLQLTKVTDIIIESIFHRDQLVLFRPNFKAGTKIHILPRPIDLTRFRERPDPGGSKIAVIGTNGHFSGLLEAFSAYRDLKAEKNESLLYFLGPIKNSFLETALTHFVNSNSLSGSIYIQDKVTDLATFLADKDYFLSCPLAVGAPGPAEAILMGLKPLLKDVPGMAELYPPEWLWRNTRQLVERFDHPPDHEKAYKLVISRHDPEWLYKYYLSVLTS
jgi:hypothetical protein